MNPPTFAPTPWTSREVETDGRIELLIFDASERQIISAEIEQEGDREIFQFMVQAVNQISATMFGKVLEQVIETLLIAESVLQESDMVRDERSQQVFNVIRTLEAYTLGRKAGMARPAAGIVIPPEDVIVFHPLTMGHTLQCPIQNGGECNCLPDASAPGFIIHEAGGDAAVEPGIGGS